LSGDGPTVAARHYDGRQSTAHEVTASVQAGTLMLGAVGYPVAQVHIVEPVGRGAWRFELPDGGMLEAGPAEGAALAGSLGHRRTRIGRWERSIALAIACIPLLGLAVWAFYAFGIPLMADRAATMLPPSADKAVGVGSYEIISRATDPSSAATERIERLRKRFAEMATEIAPDRGPARLEFRDAPAIGPNAFALPGGTVVATDQLLKMLSDNEVLAVLAHELGHVQGRHALRLVLRSSGAVILAGAVLGDATTLGNALAGLPVLVTQLSYTRAFENEADDAAYRWLDHPGRSPCYFATALNKIQAMIDKASGGKHGSGMPDWMSTHPATAERVERFEKRCPAPETSAA
jgi:Zn-dependent protease with chaperone function